jgi:2'-5' RNA ligase
MEQAQTRQLQKTVRLFIAVELPHDVKHELCRLQKNFQQKHLVVGTYPKSDAMHLTLKFIGGIPQEKVAEIQNKLRGIKFRSLAARLTQLMLFGNPRYPKVLYVDVDCPGLVELVHMLDDALVEFCAPEEREFKSHLTIVRVKQTLDSEALLALMDEMYVNPIGFTIDHFSLMQSELSGDGPQHATIERYGLIP